MSDDERRSPGTGEMARLRERIADLEARTEELGVAKRRFESLFEQSGDGITLADTRSLAFVESNEQITRLFGYSREEMLSLTIPDLDLAFSSRDIAARMAADIHSGREHTFETAYRCRDGSEKPVEITVRIQEIDGHQYSQAVVRDISERKRAEALLQASHDRFKDFAETASDRFWETDAEHRLVFVSPSRHRWSPPAQVLLGTLPWEPPAGQLSAHDAERLRDLHESREAFRNESFIWSRDGGDQTHTLMSGTPAWSAAGAFRGHRGTLLDVTAEVNASGRASRIQQQFYEAMDEMHTGVAVWDSEERLALCNAEFRRCHELIADLLAPGIDYLTTLHAIAARASPPVQLCERDDWVARRLEIHRQPSSETEELRDGQWYRINKQRLSDGGVVAIHTNITEMKHKDDALRTAQAAVIQNERWAALGRLIGTVAHDLRNPLSTIAQSVHVLDSKTQGQDLGTEKLSARIRRSLARCEGIVDELLEFAREPRLSLQTVNVDAWLRDHFAEQRLPDDIGIELDLDPDRCRVAIDPDRFTRVLVNLVDNACHAIRDAGLEGGTVYVATRRAGESIEITVGDNGAGITDEVLESAFEPLFSTRPSGFGLGLPTVRRIVERHGGKVGLGRQQGGGTCARIVLDVVP